MEPVYFPLKLAPEQLIQPILPNWQFHLFNVDLGASSAPALEREVLQKVGSYGKQLGHLAEALEVLIDRLGLLGDERLSREERDTLAVFLADVAAVRKLKDPQA